MPATTPSKTPNALNPVPANTASKPPSTPNPEPVSVKALRAGESLVVNQRLTSPNGKYWLVLEKDGMLRLRNNGGTVWGPDYEPFPDTPSPSSVELRPTGELVVFQKFGGVVWTSDNWQVKTQDTILIVQDDGHAAILSNGERLWYTYRQKDSSINRDRLVAGEWLATGQALISPSGRLSLVLQSNGDFVLSKDSQKLWWIKPVSGMGTERATVTLRDDDNLWIGWGDEPAWTSKTRRKMNGGNAVLRIAEAEDGGAAVLESDGLILWSTKSSLIQDWEPQKPLPVNLKSDSVSSGQYLSLNQNLCSANNEFCAFIQPDGIYIQRLEDDSGILWSFKPNPKASVSRLWLGLDGNLVLSGSNSVKIWESKTTNLEGGSALVMQGDGNLVLQGLKSGSWSSGSVFPATIKSPIDKLNGGESLLLDQSLVSKNGTWSLRFTTEAHFAIQNTSTKAWTYYYTRPFQQNARMLTLSTSGYLDVRGSPDRQLKWSSFAQKAGTTTAASVDPKDVRFIMQDNGSAALLVGTAVVWDSSSRPRGSSPTQISDRLVSNTTDSNAMLKLGQGIISPNGEFYLWLKPDGDFELNSKNGRRLWNSGTAGKPGVDSVILNNVGNLMVYVSKEKRSVWQSRDNLKSKYPDALNAELVIQDNGSVAIMSSGKAVWQIDSK